MPVWMMWLIEEWLAIFVRIFKVPNAHRVQFVNFVYVSFHCRTSYGFSLYVTAVNNRLATDAGELDIVAFVAPICPAATKRRLP